ncbi:unnamed protein product, partial [Rotaria sp. Silwood2]
MKQEFPIPHLLIGSVLLKDIMSELWTYTAAICGNRPLKEGDGIAFSDIAETCYS